MTIVADNMLVNGLRTEFADTYEKVRIKQADSRLSQVMDLNIQATNRQHDFGYFEAAPHMEFWRRGDTVPTEAMGSVNFNVPIYEWAKRVPWHKNDRKDDQTQTLMQMARQAGTSAALLPERMFFDLLQGGTDLLPTVPNAPDGVSLFSATSGGGGNRFGVSGGNIVTQTGTTATTIQTDFYTAITRFLAFLDKESGGQPLLPAELLEGGFIIIHPIEITEAMDSAFLQKRRITATTAQGGGAGSMTNLMEDASRTVELWPSPRLTDAGDWYIGLKSAPTLPTFFLDREGVIELSSLEGDNNGDHTRDTGEEYIQWESRSGAGVALPFGFILVQ